MTGIKTSKTARRPRGATRYPDLIGASKLTGYDHTHIARALNGERNAEHVAAALREVNHPLASIAEETAHRQTSQRTNPTT